jgi:hypothetical protein
LLLPVYEIECQAKVAFKSTMFAIAITLIRILTCVDPFYCYAPSSYSNWPVPSEKGNNQLRGNHTPGPD